MTYVTNDPALWPFIDWTLIVAYFIAASSMAVVYDWALTFGQEVELVWRQRWSFMTVLYICVRYLGILYSVIILWYLPSVPMTDLVGVSDNLDWLFLQHNDCNSCTALYFIQTWMPVVMNAMLGVIMMFLLLACTIASGVMTVMGNIGVSGEEVIISGHQICFTVNHDAEGLNLIDEMFIPTLVWEVLALCLAVWIVIKHFREMRQSPTGLTMEDCFMVLIRSHVQYFVIFAAVSIFYIGSLSPKIMALQMFVLGPRLILSIREYHATLVARSDEGTAMTAIAFQERGEYVSTSGGV
ncbi:hypothetical protein DFH29DRAFT_1083459 [Suillus ampliporus]|nr:hypothetical protein DFH29DRAFT_1083459 [Suillus ampliporus]